MHGTTPSDGFVSPGATIAGIPEQIPLFPLSGVVLLPGEVLPLQYGFSRDYSLGNLRDLSIHDMADVWRGDLGARFHRLCRQLFEEMQGAEQRRFINWYEEVAILAQRERQVMPQALPLPTRTGASTAAV